MWAARPHLGSIFEKLLHRKTFSLPAAFIFEQFVFIKAIVSHETLHKNCTCSNETGAMNNSLRNQLRTVRQNRFAICLRAVRQWLRCPN